jgi:hypothetical protein
MLDDETLYAFQIDINKVGIPFYIERVPGLPVFGNTKAIEVVLSG